MSILIDDRAGSGPQLRKGKRMPGLTDYSPLDTLGVLTRLDSGDVAFCGIGPGDRPIMVGVEVKSISDLVSSLESGRIQRQIKLMSLDYDEKWILYYGAYRPSPVDGVALQTLQWDWEKKKLEWCDYVLGRRAVPYGYIAAFLCSPSMLSYSVGTQRVSDMAEAAAWIGCLYRTWTKPWSKHKSMRVLDATQIATESTVRARIAAIPGGEPDPHTMQLARTAASLPGIRYERGIAAAQHFASIEDMFAAPASEWAKIDGIGKTLSRSIVDTIRRRAGQAKTAISKT